MTFCLGMKIEDGLVGMADTRVTTGVEWITAPKISVIERERHSMFIMTSGLRSARDKALTYFREVIEERDASFDRLYKAVNAFGEQVRRVRSEDKEALDDSGLEFNLHCVIGGQLENDQEHNLYLLYPQANWVEVVESSPYYLIGDSSYGKPLLDRALTYASPMEMALKVGYLAFDATRIGAIGVDFPLDVILYRRGEYRMVQHQFNFDDLKSAGRWWQRRLLKSIREFPSDWTDAVMERLRDTDTTE